MNKKLFLAVFTAAAASSCIAQARRHGFHNDPFNQLFSEFFQQSDARPLILTPQMHTGLQNRSQDDANVYVYTLDIPGRKNADVAIDVDAQDGTVFIKVHGRDIKKSEQTEDGFVRRSYSRSSQAFEQSFTAPSDADLTKVRAHVEDGVLTLEIEKKTETPQKSRRSITIENRAPAPAAEE